MVQKSASAYERHQNILSLLEAMDSVRVSDLATRLGVSENTIRADLELLDEQGQLTRVRGGAVPKDAPSIPAANGHRRSQTNIAQKQWIAQWAASMVEDNDTIMLDASSTVMQIADYISNRHNLVVFTNGVLVAQKLAKEPTNTVILLGGILRQDGNALTGGISEAVLQDYHIKRAFVSCSGFIPEIGFFESDIQEAQMKSLMLKATQQRIILLDSTKIGKVGLTTFASLHDVDYIATDIHSDVQAVHYIRSSGHAHTVICGEQSVKRYPPHTKDSQTIRIGFANLSESTSFSRDVRRGLEQVMQEHPEIELILADNKLNPETALEVANEMLEQDLDLMIEYQVDEKTGNLIAHKFQQAQIPLIAVDIPMVGATYFGVDNYKAGQIAGQALGDAISNRWSGQFDYLIVIEQPRAGKLLDMRIQGQFNALEQWFGPTDPDKIIRIDFENTMESCYPKVHETLMQLPSGKRIAVICFNDDAAIGALQAHRDTEAHELLIVGQGADRRLRDEIRQPNTPIIGATAYCPEKYGGQLIDLALRILQGIPVPPAVYMQHFFVNSANVDQCYPN